MPTNLDFNQAYLSLKECVDYSGLSFSTIKRIREKEEVVAVKVKSNTGGKWRVEKKSLINTLDIYYPGWKTNQRDDSIEGVKIRPEQIEDDSDLGQNLDQVNSEPALNQLRAGSSSISDNVLVQELKSRVAYLEDEIAFKNNQINIKDKQIERKDEQISEANELVRNQQVLTQTLQKQLSLQGSSMESMGSEEQAPKAEDVQDKYTSVATNYEPVRVVSTQTIPITSKPTVIDMSPKREEVEDPFHDLNEEIGTRDEPKKRKKIFGLF